MRPQRRDGQGTNQEAVRRHNLGTLLRHVHQAGQTSRAELTSAMGLNRSTIADLIGELESRGLTERTGPSENRQGAGRPSTGVRPAPDGPYVVAVDLAVAEVHAARVGLGGEIRRRAYTALSGGSEPWQVGATVADLIREVVADAPPTAPLAGIGIGIPGLVRRSDGLVRLAPNLEGWVDVSFRDIVRAALQADVPVVLANDADLGALAEHRRGAGVDVDDLIYLSGNIGVGAGVIAGGRALDGAGGYAGEVGHLHGNPRGRPCHCGDVGCWETEVGGHAIAAAIRCPADQVARLEDVLAGVTSATPELRRIGRDLGRGMGSIVNVFNPSLVVLGGYFRTLYPLVRDEIDTSLAASTMTASAESLTVTVPGLGPDSVLLGAAEMALEPLFDDPVAGLAAGLPDAWTRLAPARIGRPA